MVNIGEILLNLWNCSGFAKMFADFAGSGWQNLVMIIVACVPVSYTHLTLPTTWPV